MKPADHVTTGASMESSLPARMEDLTIVTVKEQLEKSKKQNREWRLAHAELKDKIKAQELKLEKHQKENQELCAKNSQLEERLNMTSSFGAYRDPSGQNPERQRELQSHINDLNIRLQSAQEYCKQLSSRLEQSESLRRAARDEAGHMSESLRRAARDEAGHMTSRDHVAALQQQALQFQHDFLSEKAEKEALQRELKEMRRLRVKEPDHVHGAFAGYEYQPTPTYAGDRGAGCGCGSHPESSLYTTPRDNRFLNDMEPFYPGGRQGYHRSYDVIDGVAT